MSKPLLAITATELRQRKMYVLWWSVGIVALTAFTVLAYGSIKSQADQLNKAFSGLTSTAGSFFGTSNMFSPDGYLNSQLYYITLPILFIILGVTLGGSLISKEERHHTMELLLARPISRTQLLLAKIIAADVIVAVLGAVVAVCVLLCGLIVGLGLPAGHILLATVWMTLFSGAFGAVAFMLYAASSLTRRVAAAAAILLSLGGYILTSIGHLVHGIAWLGTLFPYHYYDPGQILNGHVARGLVIYVAALYIGALIISIVGFRRRDID
jgi:ABC-2 type transport system permease protein